MKREMPVGSRRRLPWVAGGLILVLASLLLCTHLGGEYLWQDEAETALLGQNILKYGIPRAFDGKNLVSQEAGMEYGKDYLWRWSSWGDKYLAALSMKLFGRNTFGARFLFVGAGLLSIFFFHITARRLFSSSFPADLVTLFYSTSIPFLLYVRQCRYYAIVLLCVVLMLFFLLRPRRRAIDWIGFVVLSFLLFHSNYFLCLVTLGALAGSVAVLRLARRFPVTEFLWGIGAALAVTLPGMLLYRSFRPSQGVFAKAFSRNLVTYVRDGNDFFYPLIVLAALVVVLILKGRAGRDLLREMPARPLIAGGLLFILFYVLLLSLAPFAFLRYLVVLLPLFALLLSSALFLIFPGSGYLVIIFSLLLIGSNLLNILPGYALGWPSARTRPRSYLAEYIHELYRPIRGPIHGIVDYLRQHAKSDDVVLVTYGDLPIKFYTGLEVHGGLTGEDLSKFDLRRVNWIIVRYYIAAIGPRKDEYVRKFIRESFADEDFSRIDLNVPDTLFENSPNPRLHLFTTSKSAPKKVTIFRRKPPAD